MHTHTTNKRPQGPFHKVGLSFGSAGAIVRLTSDDKIMSVLASWVRTRKGGIDKVFVTTPSQLLGPAEELVSVVTLEGDSQRKRYDLTLEPEDRIKAVFEGSTPDGSWAVIYMDRIGQSPEFRSMLYRLDDSWRMLAATAKPIAKLSNWMHEDFLDHARDIPSAWTILYAAASLFGGQDPADMPESPPQLPSDLAEACAAERRFRENQRRARGMQKDPAKLAEFRSQLSPDQIAAFDALLAGQRTHV